MVITRHPLRLKDAAVVAEMRKAIAPRKGAPMGPEARGAFSIALASATPPPAGVLYTRDVVAGVPGWFCRPSDVQPDARVLFLHGGCYVLGSATALRYF